jgi:hypothetical protein
MEGRGPAISFQYQVFENAVLGLLKEIDPVKVLGKKSVGESAALAAHLAAVKHRIKAIEDQLTGDDYQDVPTLTRALRTLEDKRQSLEKKLAEARVKETKPQGAAWSEMQTLLDVARDETGRLRLRALLRSTISDCWILVVPRRSFRLAAIQLHFTEGGHRDYLIKHVPAGCGRAGSVTTKSLTSKEHPHIENLDLRRREDSTALEEVLASADLEEM